MAGWAKYIVAFDNMHVAMYILDMDKNPVGRHCPPQLYPFADELVHERFEKSLERGQQYFSNDYFKLTQHDLSIKEDDSSPLTCKIKPVKFPESFVCSLWLEQMFKSKYLFTLDLKRIEVIFPGQWNFEKGPDFKNARIKLERGEIVKGDVEIHNFSSEWKSHRHQLNAEYNNVILHVFLWNDKGGTGQIKANGLSFLQIEMASFLKKDVKELYSLMKLEEYPFPLTNNQGHCAEILNKADEKRTILFLNLAGEARLLKKTDRYLKKASKKNYNQLLYEGMMESLGFKYSKLQFVQIAKTVTLRYLREKVTPLPQQEKRKHIETIFSGVAGFLDHYGDNLSGLDQETKLYFNKLREIWTLYEKDFITKKMHFSCWNFSGVRPANYPFRRLAGMSHFLSQNVDINLIAKIYPAISKWSGDSNEKNKKDHILNLFQEQENSFWSFRYSPNGKKLSSPKHLIGKERIWDMIINVFLPVLLSFAKQCNSFSMERVLYQVYNHFPQLAPNRITRFMEEFVLGAVKNKKKLLNRAKRQQALHQIYEDYCNSNKNACDNCKFYFIAKHLILGKTLSGS